MVQSARAVVIMTTYPYRLVDETSGKRMSPSNEQCGGHEPSDLEEGAHMAWRSQEERTPCDSSVASVSMEQRRFTAPKLMRWRWFSRALNTTLFQSYAVSPLLRGTWLWNVWLKWVGADVSMGALMLCDVRDHDLLKVSWYIRTGHVCIAMLRVLRSLCSTPNSMVTKASLAGMGFITTHLMDDPSITDFLDSWCACKISNSHASDYSMCTRQVLTYRIQCTF